MPTSGIKLFRAFGIQVYLHWTWIFVAIFEIQTRKNRYTSIKWNIAEYLALFGIVLMHEFGHALACRSVGGEADRIMLWPLGGVAFVKPPRRAGAVLWSIAAGPLVNVILVPVTFGAMLYLQATPGTNPNPVRFAETLATINLLLLVFNMLPIYPLDGGQIVRALLWFFIGEGKSLMVASIIGLVGAGLGILAALLFQDVWLIILAAFAAMQSWAGFQSSKALTALAGAPRRADARCPACGVSPPLGPLWTCSCGQQLDPFETGGVCPRCGGVFPTTTCPNCGQASPMDAWRGVVA